MGQGLILLGAEILCRDSVWSEMHLIKPQIKIALGAFGLFLKWPEF
jgi:hypothetical protein